VAAGTVDGGTSLARVAAADDVPADGDGAAAGVPLEWRLSIR
jgi:hypothetical protein